MHATARPSQVTGDALCSLRSDLGRRSLRWPSPSHSLSHLQVQDTFVYFPPLLDASAGTLCLMSLPQDSRPAPKHRSSVSPSPLPAPALRPLPQDENRVTLTPNTLPSHSLSIHDPVPSLLSWHCSQQFWESCKSMKHWPSGRADRCCGQSQASPFGCVAFTCSVYSTCSLGSVGTGGLLPLCCLSCFH